jgi:hypothetical protein
MCVLCCDLLCRIYHESRPTADLRVCTCNWTPYPVTRGIQIGTLDSLILNAVDTITCFVLFHLHKHIVL